MPMDTKSKTHEMNVSGSTSSILVGLEVPWGWTRPGDCEADCTEDGDETVAADTDCDADCDPLSLGADGDEPVAVGAVVGTDVTVDATTMEADMSVDAPATSR